MLVDADRGSLFLVDSESQELYARVFDQETKSPKKLTQDWVYGRTTSLEMGRSDLDQISVIRCVLGRWRDPFRSV